MTFDQKVERVIQEIVETNFELYKRITDDRVFGEAVKNLLFDQYLRKLKVNYSVNSQFLQAVAQGAESQP